MPFTTLLFGLERSGQGLWQAGFTLPTGISWEPGRERRKEKEVFINGLIFTVIYVSDEICGAMSMKSTHLIGQPLAQGNKISSSGDCWTMDAFSPKLPEITHPCVLCATPSHVLFCQELLVPQHWQHLATPAVVPGPKLRLGRCCFQDAGRNRQEIWVFTLLRVGRTRVRGRP